MVHALAWRTSLTSKDTRGHRVMDFLKTLGAWLLSKFVRFLPAFFAALHTSCYLWPRRYQHCRNGRYVLQYTMWSHFLPMASPSSSSWLSPFVRVSLAHPELWALAKGIFPRCLTGRISCQLMYDAGYSGGPLPCVRQPAVPRIGNLNRCRTFASSDFASQRTLSNSIPCHCQWLASIHSHSRSPRHFQPQPPVAQQTGGNPIATPERALAAVTTVASWSRYTGCTAVFSIRYKIHGYEPGDLRPDWRTRLDSLTHSDVTRMVGSYVRPGCVELTVDFLVPAAKATVAPAGKARVLSGSGTLGFGIVACAQHSAKPTVNEFAAASPPRLSCEFDGTLDVLARGKVKAPDVVRILNALGLNGRTPDDRQAGPAPPAQDNSPTGTTPLPQATPTREQVQVEVLGTEPAAHDAPQVVHLWPRVLTLPSSLQQQQAQHVHQHAPDVAACRPVTPLLDAFELEPAAWGSEEDEEDHDGRTAAASATTAADGTVLLRATLCRAVGKQREGRTLSMPSVFARTNNEILAATVARFRQLPVDAPLPSCAGMGTHGQDGGAEAVCASSWCSAAAGCRDVERYELEVLLAVPRKRGLVLVEMQWNGQPGQVMPLLCLPAADAAVASELQSLAEAAVAAVAAPSSAAPTTAAAAVALNAALARRRRQLLDSFLLDAGIWTAAAAAAAQTRMPQGGLRADTNSPVMLQEQLHPRQRALLGANLLRFAVHGGLRATEAWLVQGLAELEPDLVDVEARGKRVGMDGLAAAACDSAVSAVAAAGAAADGGNSSVAPSCRISAPTSTSVSSSTMKAGLHVEGSCDGGGGNEAASATMVSESLALIRDEKGCEIRRRHANTTYVSDGVDRRTVPQTSGSLSAVRQGLETTRRLISPAAAAAAAVVVESTDLNGWEDWRLALRQVLNVRAANCSEEAEYQAYVAPWIINQEHVIQTFEILALLTLLFRARADLLNPVNITTLLGGLPGLVSLAAYLLLPPRAWQRAAVAVKLARYVTYMAAKALSVVLNLPLPPGVSSYQLGIGMVLHEGLLLPLACLLPLRAAIFVTITKVLPCMAMMLMSGVALNCLQAGLRCAAVAAVALPNTILCHTYLRVCFARWRRQTQRQRRTSDGGAAVAKLH